MQPQAFSVVWDVGALDVPWVVGPGLAALAVAAVLVWARRRLTAARHRARARLLAAAVALFLAAVWWTAGGLGAWRAGVERLRNGTADFIEGTLVVPTASDAVFRVGPLSLQRARDAFLPARHACRWPAVRRFSGSRARLWFFQGDVLRLEVDTGD